MSEIVFDHEKLIVYQKSVEFVKWVHQILLKIKLKNPTIDQFERAADSIALNIAEGNGKYSGKDRCRYFDIAKGSSLECSSCLDLLFAKDLISNDALSEGRERLKE
ncbi:MAG: four helix bundle protein, partial [Melioribacter sp. RIFOXYB12_FULL_38_5]